ncbi:MAG TPA: indole-3-glycerol phosphate synthase TrpC [Terriglobales bacterium]|nr:indole-3-glycerol phosphate synthase TrpC [Terriglobales bacterium]
MGTKLDEIVATVRKRVAAERARAEVRDLEGQAQRHVPRGFRGALQSAARNGVAVIAELKKASPSRGLIRQDFRPAELARELQESGAAALSVLTDTEFFQGSLQNLTVASGATHLPCLRKDFVVDEFQLLEARAYGADAVLLIVAALSSNELATLGAAGRQLGLDILCEVHDEAELQRALDAGFDLIGVNSRDLRTFKVDLNTALRLGGLLPKSVLGVAESGIESAQDIAQLQAEGYRGFLIGESLMRAESPGRALQNLLAETRKTVSSF